MVSIIMVINHIIFLNANRNSTFNFRKTFCLINHLEMSSKKNPNACVVYTLYTNTHTHVFKTFCQTSIVSLSSCFHQVIVLINEHKYLYNQHCYLTSTQDICCNWNFILIQFNNTATCQTSYLHTSDNIAVIYPCKSLFVVLTYYTRLLCLKKSRVIIPIALTVVATLSGRIVLQISLPLNKKIRSKYFLENLCTKSMAVLDYH